MPTLSSYYKAHSDHGFILFGIEAGDSKEQVEKFVDEYNLSFPILLDPNSKSMILFKNDNLPSSYVIDRNGNVVLAWTGPISREMLEKYVTPLLEQ
jgi:peroxiredoxin